MQCRSAHENTIKIVCGLRFDDALPPPSRPYIFILCVHYKRCRFPKTYTADEHNSAEVCRTTTRRFRVVGRHLYIITVNSRQLGEIASWVYAVGLTLPTTSGNI